MKKTYKIEVDCASCAALMEDAAKKVDGVKDACISFMTLKLTLDFEDSVDEEKVMRGILKACRRIEDDCEIYF